VLQVTRVAMTRHNSLAATGRLLVLRQCASFPKKHFLAFILNGL
jgi:hypothetical protein